MGLPVTPSTATPELTPCGLVSNTAPVRLFYAHCSWSFQGLEDFFFHKHPQAMKSLDLYWFKGVMSMQWGGSKYRTEFGFAALEC